MDVRAPLDFAQRLMREVWEPFDADAVPRFYRRDVIGHYRKQLLTYDDVVHRLVTDHTPHADAVYDIRDIVADDDKWAIRFVYTATAMTIEQIITTEVIYFYHLKDGKIAEFWLLSDTDFDYKAD